MHFFRERYLSLLLPVALLAVLNPGRTLRLALGAVTLWRTVTQARLQAEARAPPPRLP